MPDSPTKWTSVAARKFRVAPMFAFPTKKLVATAITSVARAKSAMAMTTPRSPRRPAGCRVDMWDLLEVVERAVPDRDLGLGDRLDRAPDVRVGIREIRLDRDADLRQAVALPGGEGRRRTRRHQLHGRVAPVEVPER